jgi:hypothetical protein
MTDLQNRIAAYLRSDDRQWHRAHRQAHARLQLSKVTDPEDVLFWTGVLSAFSLAEQCVIEE